MKLKHVLLSKIRNIFLNTGDWIYDRPKIVLSVSSLIAIIFAFSFKYVKFENRADVLYSMPISQSRSDLAKQSAIFGPPPRVNMLFVLSADGHNVLTKHDLNHTKKLIDYISNSIYVPNHPEMLYKDVCFRQSMQFGESDNSDCVLRSPLDMYRNENAFGEQITTRQWPYIPNISLGKITKADLSLIQPRVIETASGGTRIVSAEGFMIIFETSNDSNLANYSYLWEEQLIRFVNEELRQHTHNSNKNQMDRSGFVNNLFSKLSNKLRTKDEHIEPISLMSEFDDFEFWKDFTVIINAQRSWQDELTQTTKIDDRLVFDYLVAVILISLYMIIVNRTGNYVKSKIVCGLFGALSAFLGFIVGAGICYACSIKHAPTMHATPFLVLAIGLDNTFVVLNFYTLAYTTVNRPKERCRNALADSGIALAITTLTSVTSFGVGAFGPYVAIRNFCIVTSCGLVGSFIYNIIFFYPILCLEAKAESQGKIWFVPDSILYKLPLKKLTQESYDKWKSRQLAKDTTPNFRNKFDARPEPISEPSPNINLDYDLKKSSDLFDFNKPQSLTSNSIDICKSSSNHSLHSLTSGNSEGYKQKSSSLAQLKVNFMNSKTMFEIATIQWSLTKLKLQVAKEQKRRMILNNGQVTNISTLVTSVPNEEITMNNISNNFSQELNNDSHSNLQSLDSINLQCGNDTLNSTIISSLMDSDFNPKTQSKNNTNSQEIQITKLSDNVLEELSNSVKGALLLAEFPKGNKGRRSHSFILNYIAPYLLHNKILNAIIFIMILYILGCTFLGAKYLSAGLDLEYLTPPNSYLREAFDLSHSKIDMFVQQTDVVFSAPKLLKLNKSVLKADIITPDSKDTRASSLKSLMSVKNSVLNKEKNATSGITNTIETDDGYFIPDPLHLPEFLKNDYCGSAESEGQESNNIAGVAAATQDMSKYYDSLGELHFWEEDSIRAVLELDKTLRLMDDTQDILNGIVLFLQENSHKILAKPTYYERRTTFYQLLAKWLRYGISGRHVREHFHFNVKANKEDWIEISENDFVPPLLSVRIVMFHYNFLNSYVQSKYMVNLRKILNSYSEDWANGSSISDKKIDASHKHAEIRRLTLLSYIRKPDNPFTIEINNEARRIRQMQRALNDKRRLAQNADGSDESTDDDDDDINLDVVESTKPHDGILEKDPKLIPHYISADAPYPKYAEVYKRSKIDPDKPLKHSLFTAFPFMETFLYFETDITIWSTTLLSMLSAFVSIILVSSVLLEGARTVLLVVLMILSVDIGVFGFMAYLDIRLNILSMILLVLSIGFSVDYTVHVIHVYIHTLGRTCKDRTLETLILICNPIFNGAVSTLITILPIYLRDYYILQTFFVMTSLVIVFGFLNGVIFLPAITARFGYLLDTPNNKKSTIFSDITNLVRSVHRIYYPIADDFQSALSL